MQTQVAERLGEIASIEQELATVVSDSAERVQDPGLRDRMQDAAQRHRQHAEELLGVEGVRAQQERGRRNLDREVEAIHRRAEHAVGEDGLMAALGHLEQEEEVRFGEALAADIEPELADVLRAQQSDISDDARIFLDEATGIAPEVGDPRDTV